MRQPRVASTCAARLQSALRRRRRARRSGTGNTARAMRWVCRRRHPPDSVRRQLPFACHSSASGKILCGLGNSKPSPSGDASSTGKPEGDSAAGSSDAHLHQLASSGAGGSRGSTSGISAGHLTLRDDATGQSQISLKAMPGRQRNRQLGTGGWGYGPKKKFPQGLCSNPASSWACPGKTVSSRPANALSYCLSQASIDLGSIRSARCSWQIRHQLADVTGCTAVSY